MSRADRPRKNADDWVNAGLRTLAAGSIGDVKVERLATQLGVTKGSFYWHFDDRDALLRAMRDRWVERGTEAFIALVDDRSDDDPAASLELLVRATMEPSDRYDGVEAAVREWSVSDRATAQVCAKVDERRLAYVGDLLMAAGVDPDQARRRAEVLYRIIIGDYIWRRHGGQPADISTVVEVARSLCQP